MVKYGVGGIGGGRGTSEFLVRHGVVCLDWFVFCGVWVSRRITGALVHATHSASLRAQGPGEGRKYIDMSRAQSLPDGGCC